MRITVYGAFAFGAAVFLLGFAVVAFGQRDVPAGFAFLSMIIVGLSATVTYLLAGGIARRFSVSAAAVPAIGVRSLVWWASFTVAAGGAVTFVALSENTALSELVQNLIEPGRASSAPEIEVRLSTAFMPMWSQVLFEVARRLALPICLIEFVVAGFPSRRRLLVGAAVFFLAAVFIFGTLDRTIPLMYIGMVYLAWLAKRRVNPLMDRWLYVALALIIFVLVGFKIVQYGDVRSLDTRQNSTISEFVGSDGTIGEEATGPVGYAVYVARSTVERIVLSPVAMALYAFESYDESNFQQWSSNRILSLLGFGRYVSPFEEGQATKYHHAFPVTFVGDLWRQGGFLYMPIFGAILGALLLAIDRTVFARPGYNVWQPLAIMGVAFLFYGNALNATALMLMLGALAGHLFVNVASRVNLRSLSAS